MPIYEYQCRACQHRFEALLSRSGDSPPCCPQCGSSQVEKLLSAFAVIRGGSSSPPGPCGSDRCENCRL